MITNTTTLTKLIRHLAGQWLAWSRVCDVIQKMHLKDTPPLRLLVPPSRKPPKTQLKLKQGTEIIPATKNDKTLKSLTGTTTMITNATILIELIQRLPWQWSACSPSAKSISSRAGKSRHKEVSSVLLSCLSIAAMVCVCLPGAANAQCSNSAVAEPITVDDEVSTASGSRQLVNGTGTTVDTSVPGQIKIDANYPPIGFSAIPTKRVGTWQPILTSSTTFTAVGITAPTAAGTPANNSGSSGVLIKYPTTAVLNNVAGVHSTAYTDTEYQMGPVFACRIETGSSLATQRIWVGLTASALSASATPAVNCAAFRFDTGASDTAFQCYTDNGTSNTVTSSGVTVVASSTYDLVIDMSSSSQILFYVNGTLVNTATTTLPTSTTALGPEMTITTLAATAENLSVGTMRLESY